MSGRYEWLSWPRLRDAVPGQPCVLLPTGATEQHGPHLPLDVDTFLAQSICLEAGRRAPDRILVLPPVPYGLNLHHIDFPGTIHVEPETFIAYCSDITKSLAQHGFRKILLVNGHGSNSPLVDLVARKTTLNTDALCAAVNYHGLAMDAYGDVRDTAVVAHADEFETSLYLHLAPERVQMDLAVAGEDVTGTFVSSDSTSEFPVRFHDYWSRWTSSGVHGDPTTASAEKGKAIFEGAVENLIRLADEWRAWPIAERRDLRG
ncbi:creatininase family protein [Kribbella sandramycini]|uniref:Creatininase family protein n=1 Tax=Kribbella sandramycini TaxID=60450 RepID=A0A7Y4KYL7_9ACTN|nr:creatininase family protein [Kribbella sandramycini]MBB6569122.1 creatinine amidohydrolase [Kribbella sandramycini]NOL41035.1 creatininase family protein [Kribbella sandramycini]